MLCIFIQVRTVPILQRKCEQLYAITSNLRCEDQVKGSLTFYILFNPILTAKWYWLRLISAAEYPVGNMCYHVKEVCLSRT